MSVKEVKEDQPNGMYYYTNIPYSVETVSKSSVMCTLIGGSTAAGDIVSSIPILDNCNNFL